MNNSIQRFKASAIAILAIILLIITGCGGSASPNNANNASTTPQPSVPAATPTSQDDPETEEVTPERQKVGDSLVLYSAGPKGLADNILKGFEDKYNIKVEMFQGTTGAILARMEAEKANPIVDVVILASYPSAAGIKSQGITMAYPEALHADKLQDGWLDDDYHFFGYSGSALGITYNTTLVDTPPTDWSDMTKLEWKDAVNIPDAQLSGSALDFVSGYINVHGEEGWSLFEQLNENGVAVAGANNEALDPVITGARSAVMAGVDYMAYSAIARGESVDIVYPASGTVVNPRPAAILEWSKNVENAKLFIDYLLSDEAQQMVIDAYIIPGRKDILADNRANMQDIPVLDYDWNWMEENAETVIQRLTDTFK